MGPGVFVPRPETEQVAQLAIDALRATAEPEPIAVDLGSGSGAIALSMATEVPHARVWAVENSPEAFPWTRRNVDEVGAENLELVFGDLATALPELDGRVAVVISNPPYVPAAEIPVDPEVHLHDPVRGALRRRRRARRRARALAAGAPSCCIRAACSSSSTPRRSRRRSPRSSRPTAGARSRTTAT